MAYAEVALRQIKSLRQSAVPRNYEIWYVYATGHNADLNKVVNETLARNGKLTESDLDQIYDAYLSHGRTTERIDKIGARVVSEIEDVMSLITDALGMSASFGANLNGANQKLSLAGDRDQVMRRGRTAGGIDPRDAGGQPDAGRAGSTTPNSRSTICSRISRRSAPRA